MRHRWLTIGAIAFATVLLLASIRFVAVPAFVGTPDTVHIVVTDIQLPSAKETAIFDHQFSRQASAVYRQLTAGTQLTSGDVQSCPSYSNALPYYRYELTFFRLGMQVATAVSDARGCADFTVSYFDGSTEEFFWMSDSHISFWIQLHQLVNAPEPVNTCIGFDARGYCMTIQAL
jgi:hypothetical protein